MKANEIGLTFINLTENVEKQLISAQDDVEDIKAKFTKHEKKKNDLGQKVLSRQKRGPVLLAFGALTAVTDGAGLACSLGCIFGSGGVTDQNRKEFKFALFQLEENNKRWNEIKGKMNNEMFIIADEVKNVNSCKRKIIETKKNYSEVPDKAVTLILYNSRLMMACNQVLYSRDQMLHVQTNLTGSLSVLLIEIKSHRTTVFSYKYTILNSVITMFNKLIPMVLLPKTALEEILEAVVIWQTKAIERLLLAIATSLLLAYYDTKIFRHLDVQEDGKFFTLAIPFVTKPTVLNLLRAIPFPMPNEGTNLKNFIAITESTPKTAPLLHDEIDRCAGSSSFLFAIIASRRKLLMTHA